MLKDKSFGACFVYFMALSSNYDAIWYRIQTRMQAPFQKLDNMANKMKKNGIDWLPIVCPIGGTQGEFPSFLTQFHQNQNIF